MVTKLDVFVELYNKGGPRRIVDIVKSLNQKKSEYDRIRKILESLIKLKLISKSKYGYERTMNTKNQNLYDMLRYCIKNGVNYNEIFDKSVAKYLSKGLLKKSFSAKDISLHPRTFGKISAILEKNGFLIIISRKPFRAILPYNSFLGDLVAYYGYRPVLTKKQQYEFFEDIKKELLKFKKLRVSNNRKYQEIIETFQIKFIHHSLSIEGNPITLSQTFKILRDKVVPDNLSVEAVQEVQNYQKAFFQMLQNVRDELPLTKESMLDYHFLAMQHKKEWAGKIRDDQVIIHGNEDYKVAHYKEINRLLDELVDNYNEFIKEKKHTLKEILDFSGYLHNEFQHIHPFFDGNSRTTRLITFHFLQMNGIPIFDIPLGMLEEYVSSTKGSKKRDDHKLRKVLQQIILYNLKSINEKLSE